MYIPASASVGSCRCFVPLDRGVCLTRAPFVLEAACSASHSTRRVVTTLLIENTSTAKFSCSEPTHGCCHMWVGRRLGLFRVMSLLSPPGLRSKAGFGALRDLQRHPVVELQPPGSTPVSMLRQTGMTKSRSACVTSTKSGGPSASIGGRMPPLGFCLLGEWWLERRRRIVRYLESPPLERRLHRIDKCFPVELDSPRPLVRPRTDDVTRPERALALTALRDTGVARWPFRVETPCDAILVDNRHVRVTESGAHGPGLR